MGAASRVQITAREVILITLVALALIRGCAVTDEPAADLVVPAELP